MKGTLALALIVLLLVSIFTGLTWLTYSRQISSLTRSDNTVTQLWSFNPSESQASTPVVSNGYVYFATGSEGAPLGFGEGSFYCLKTSTGAIAWSASNFASDFVLANGYLYDSSGADIFCVNASTGDLQWNFGEAVHFGSPVISGGILYVGCINSTSTPSDIGVVYALNALTGNEIWNYSGPVGTRFDLNPIVALDGNLYAVSSTLNDNSQGYPISAYSAVYAFEAANGKELWNYTAQGSFMGLTAGDYNIYVSCDYYNAAEAAGGDLNYYAGGVLAFNAQNGQSLWNYTNQGQVTSFSFAGDNVYLISSYGVLYAINPSDGSVNWNYTAGTGLGSILPVNGYLYVGSSYGAYCFNMSNGTVLWNFASGSFAGSSTCNPTYADGVIYIGWNGPASFAPVTQNNFYALNAFNGKILWNYTLGYTDPSATASNGVIYIGSDFVTTRSPDFQGSAVVLALKPEKTTPILTIASITIVIAVLVGAVTLLRAKKQKLQKQ